MAECEFVKANGASCGAPAMTGSRWCFFHSPDEATKRREAQSRGGLASSQRSSAWEWTPVEPLSLKTAWGMVQLMTEQLNELRGLEPSPRKATAIFYGINILLRLYVEFKLWEWS